MHVGLLGPGERVRVVVPVVDEAPIAAVSSLTEVKERRQRSRGRLPAERIAELTHPSQTVTRRMVA